MSAYPKEGQVPPLRIVAFVVLLLLAFTTYAAAQTVHLENRVVTGSFQTASGSGTSCFFFLQESNSSSGTKVFYVPGTVIVRGDIVTVDGTLAVADHEKRLTATTVTVTGHDESRLPRPLGMNHKTLAQSVIEGKGVQVSGLYVKIWGYTTNVAEQQDDYGNRWLYVDDGTGLVSDTRPGLKVYYSAFGGFEPQVGQLYVPEGNLTSEWTADGRLIPVLWMR